MKRYGYLKGILAGMLLLSPVLSKAGEVAIPQDNSQGKTIPRVCVINACQYGNTFSNKIKESEENGVAQSTILNPSSTVVGSTRTSTATSVKEYDGEDFEVYVNLINNVDLTRDYKDRVSSYVSTETVKLMLDSLGVKAFTPTPEEMDSYYKQGYKIDQIYRILANRYKTPVLIVLKGNKLDMHLTSNFVGKGKKKTSSGSVELGCTNTWEILDGVKLEKQKDLESRESVIVNWEDVPKTKPEDLPNLNDLMFFVNGKAAQSFVKWFVE